MAFIPAAYKNIYEAWAKEVFRLGANVTEAIGRGFRSVQTEMLKAMIERGVFNLPKDAAILLLNDFDLTLTKMLRDRGYYNIYLLVLDTSETKAYSKYMFKVKYQDKNFKKMFPDGLVFWKQILTVEMKEVHDVGVRGLKKSTHTEYFIKGVDQLEINEFDLVIANPPYGRVGAELTNAIRKYVKYKQYINLLPMVDYEKLQKEKVALWQYIDTDSITSIPFGEGAAVVPLICNITKTACNNLSADAFRIACLDAKSTIKYFTHNVVRSYTFTIMEQFAGNDLTCVIALPMRVKSGNHSGQANLGKTLKSQFFQINNGHKQAVTEQETQSICCTTVNFKTVREKENVAAFLYSDLGYKFASWLMTGMARDAFHLREHAMWFPRVDWTRTWTVEEILADYGYTEDEINAVIADLTNFRGMED
jgi:hypothetical protein